MIRLIHLADVHLGASYSAFGGLAGDRRRAVLDAFRRLPGIAADHDAHAVLIAGDLFDGPRPATDVVALVREVFRKLAEAERPVFLVPGNHDSNLSHPNPYREDLGGAAVFQDPAFGAPSSVETPDGLLNVYGASYDPAREADPISSFRRAGLPGAHVVLLHGSVQDAPHWAGSRNSLRLTDEGLASLEVDYIALGDYHRFRPPGGFAAGKVPACYCGSFAATDLTELGPRGYVVAELEHGVAPRVALHSSGVTEVVDLGRLDVSGQDGVAGVVDAIAARVPDESIPVVTLEGQAAFRLDAELIVNGLRERYGCAKVADRSFYFSSTRLSEIAEQDTVAGHVVRLGRRRIEEAGDARARRIADRALRIALGQLGVE
jgi:DNA repair exonuclease SbcCD nuclease subunit